MGLRSVEMLHWCCA